MVDTLLCSVKNELRMFVYVESMCICIGMYVYVESMSIL